MQDDSEIQNALKAQLLWMVPVPVAFQDKEQNIIWANKAHEEATGLSLQEMVGKKCYSVWGLSRSCRNCPVVTAIAAGMPCEAELTPQDQNHWPANQGSWLVKAVPIFNDEGSIFGAVGSPIDISNLTRKEKHLKEALEETEMLLKETHHQAKNNMQLISSLLSLQAVRKQNTELNAALQDSQSRVRAMILIHETLYQSRAMSEINLKPYIKKLIHNLFHTYNNSPRHIVLKMNVEDVFLDIDQAIPCGLVLNELVSNSMKYAFPNDLKGEISLKVHLDEKGNVALAYGDNGVGLPENFDVRKTDTLGLSLAVKLMERQLGGKMEINRTDGLKYTFTFTPRNKVRETE